MINTAQNKETRAQLHDTDPVGEVEVYKSPRFLRGIAGIMRAHKRAQQLDAENQVLRAQNQDLVYENSHDELTGLLNKKAWRNKIAERMQSHESDAHFGLIFMDMDAFKSVNDNFGHVKGDELLKDFGLHMKASFRRAGESVSYERLFRTPNEDEPAIGRYGGDEFGILVDLSGRGHGDGDGLSLEERLQVATSYTKSVTDEFVAMQDDKIRALNFNISLGGAVWDSDNPISAEELIQQADQAMYQAKPNNGSSR